MNPRSIKQRDPIGDEKAFMDMGLNNLFAVVTTNGYVLLVKGGSIKSEYYWWKREISTYQAVRDLLRNAGPPTWILYHERYLEAMHTGDERLRHLYLTSIRFLAENLWSRGVRKLYIGYPVMLSQSNGNEYNTNIWWYRKIVLWIVDVFREYGIEVKWFQSTTQAENAQYAVRYARTVGSTGVCMSVGGLGGRLTLM